MTSDTKVIVTCLAVAGVGFLVISSMNKKTNTAGTLPATSDPVPPKTPATSNTVPSTPKPSTPVTINRDLLLKNGSKGNEVKELQKLLGVTADGSFGPQTEAKLLAKKGVKQTTLNLYAKTNDVNPNPLKVGDWVMANKNKVNAYQNKMLANGDYYKTKEIEEVYEFGAEIGKIIAITNDKLSYVVQQSGFFSTLVWVAAADVKKF